MIRMRIEPFGVGSVIHVIQRGGRGGEIIRDENDRRRFLRSLFYLNDTHADEYWHRATSRVPLYERPAHWPERQPLVRILALTLLSNHFHLLLQEIGEGGTTKFMQRLCGSMSMCFNRKYSEKGSLFQGSYHARTVSGDAHFNYLAFYILVKNTLEMYPGGLRRALANFDEAWRWALAYPFSSLGGQVAGAHTPIMDDPDGLVATIVGPGDAFKQEAKELLELHMASRGEEFASLMLEPW